VVWTGLLEIPVEFGIGAWVHANTTAKIIPQEVKKRDVAESRRQGVLGGTLHRFFNGQARNYSWVEVWLHYAYSVHTLMATKKGGYNTPNAARAWAYLTSIIVFIFSS